MGVYKVYFVNFIFTNYNTLLAAWQLQVCSSLKYNVKTHETKFSVVNVTGEKLRAI